MKSRTICHCFNYTIEDIVQDFKINHRSTLLERIQKKIASKDCRCAENHPEGR